MKTKDPIIRVEAPPMFVPTFKVALDPNSDHWIAVCAHPPLTASAVYWSDLLAVISESLDLWLRGLDVGNELMPYLKAYGWLLRDEVPQSSACHFDVPFLVIRTALHALDKPDHPMTESDAGLKAAEGNPGDFLRNLLNP